MCKSNPSNEKTKNDSLEASVTYDAATDIDVLVVPMLKIVCTSALTFLVTFKSTIVRTSSVLNLPLSVGAVTNKQLLNYNKININNEIDK